MDKLRIRKYKKSDDSIIWELHKLGLAEIGFKPRHGSHWNRDLDDIKNVYLKEGDFILGEYGGKVVAMGAFKKTSDEIAEVKRMRVHPDFQRRGFGQTILKELEKRAKKIGYRKMVLDTSTKSIKAQNLYKKNGYTETGRKILHKIYHAIFYEKELG